MDTYELIEKTKKIASQFPIQLNKHELFIDLAEELGELAQAILITDKRKITNDPKKQKSIADISDALCDALYDIFLLADTYKIDLPEEYQKMLVQMQQRFDTGEFHDD